MCCLRNGFEKLNGYEWLKTCALCLLTGALGGVIGAMFVYVLHWVTATRTQCGWLILLLPVGGLATVWIFRLFNLNDHGGVGEIVKNLESGTPVRTLVAPLMFIGTAITHLFGGSSGKEGAALQIGGGGAAAIARLFRLKGTGYSILIMAGMSAVFAAVFGTPLTAVFFIMEFRASRKLWPLAIIPCLLSSFLAADTAALFGVTKEVLRFSRPIEFDVATGGKIALLSVLAGALGAVMCFVFHKGRQLSRQYIKNPLLRILAGSCLIIAMTLVVGDMRYSGTGMDMAINAINGNAAWFDFALKLVLTAVTLSAGFKGGEIVPTFCIGATFGCVMGQWLGISPSLAAAIGLVALFAYATNSLVSAIFLGLELFGVSLLPYVILACILTAWLSGENGLFYGRPISPLLLYRQKLKTAR